MGIDERMAHLETVTAVQQSQMAGLATKADIHEMIGEFRKEINARFDRVDSRFDKMDAKVSDMDTRLGVAEIKLDAKPDTSKVYLLIGGALALGLGAVFTMFKYMVPLPH